MFKNQELIESCINDYFYENVKLPRNRTVNYEKCSDLDLHSIEDNIYIAISKDSVYRQKKMKMERSIFFFIFENKLKFENAKNINFKKMIKQLHKKLYKKFLKLYPELLVRNYIIFVSVVSDVDGNVRFFTNKVNTKYEFVQTITKILSNPDKTLIIDNIVEEINIIKSEKSELLSCIDAYNGELTFYNETEKNFTDIVYLFKIINTILVEGPARSGKTIIAMRILNEFKEFKLLLMNYHFYQDLKAVFAMKKIPFPTDRIFHHDLSHKDGCWKDKDVLKTNISYLVIDEAQRLSDSEISCILSYSNRCKTIFLGDEFQRLNPNYDVGLKPIIQKCNVKKINYKKISFESAVGIPNEIVNSILYLLGKTDYLVNELPETYEIGLCSSIDKFVDLFNKTNGIKHYVVPTILNYNYEIKSGEQIIMSNQKDDTKAIFNSIETRDKYMLNTYKMISRELQNVFLYIHNDIKYDKNDGIYLTLNRKYNDYVLFHLYVLMTRATHKLVIYCEDKSLETYFRKRLYDIKNVKFEEKNSMFHKVFGYGLIVSEDEKEYKVRFNQGAAKIIKKRK